MLDALTSVEKEGRLWPLSVLGTDGGQGLGIGVSRSGNITANLWKKSIAGDRVIIMVRAEGETLGETLCNLGKLVIDGRSKGGGDV